MLCDIHTPPSHDIILARIPYDPSYALFNGAPVNNPFSLYVHSSKNQIKNNHPSAVVHYMAMAKRSGGEFIIKALCWKVEVHGKPVAENPGRGNYEGTITLARTDNTFIKNQDVTFTI